MTDQIEKVIEIDAPVSRVWRALTDYREFGTWFRVRLDGPFVAGEKCGGQITHPGYEHLRMEVVVQRIEPEHLFSLTWHPYAVDEGVDYAHEEPTLVTFTLAPTAGGGTLLRVVESGFDRIPAHRRAKAFRMNDGGWQAQMENIARHVGQAA